jgi:FlaA1/EpsC-like NDP-sugar epimerase
MVLGQDTYLALVYEQGLLKIGGITVLTIVLSYYFDLYEPQIVSVPLEIYFRILLVLGFDCFALSLVLYFYPEADIAQFVYPVGFALLSPVLIAWRKIYGRLVSHKFFRERVYVLGAGEQARSIVHTIQARPDIGMEVVYWADLHLDKPERRQVWIEDLARLTDARPGVGAHRIIVAMEDSRDELPVQELLNLRFRGITVEKVGDLRERLSGKIQLDGLHPSSFLYAEGFRIARRSS